MELTLLSEVFHRPITNFPRDPHTTPALPNGSVVSFQTTGTHAYLFVTPSAAWLWNHVQASVPIAGLASELCIFEVEVTPACLYITDVLVLDTTVLTSRDYLERVEAARKWMHLSGQGLPVHSDRDACRSAYPSYVLQLPKWQLHIQRAYPAYELGALWARRPSETQRLIAHRTLDHYRPRAKKRGRPT
jgi:hypothetical protein